MSELPAGAPPKVFISYSHDSPEHREKVLNLSQRLRRRGFDCEIDQYLNSPPEGWAAWSARKLQEANLVLVICTRTYHEKALSIGRDMQPIERPAEDPNKPGKGAIWEIVLTYQHIFDERSRNTKFIPVLFESTDRQHIPVPLRPATPYIDPADFESLVKRMLSAPPAIPAPLGELLSVGGLDPGRPEFDLFERVIRICELRASARADQVKIERRAVPSPFHHVAEVNIAENTGPVSSFLLCATAAPLTLETLSLFREQVHTRYTALDPLYQATIVVGHDASTRDTREVALKYGIKIVPFTEYQGLIDFSQYLDEQSERLARDPVYPPDLYVPQHLVTYRAGEDSESSNDALATVSKWLSGPNGRFVLLLGDFGTGKTFLLHELARRMARESRMVIPILIEMRMLEKARSLNSLVAQHLTNAGMDRIDMQSFRYMLRQGRIVLLFDGFDELALRVSYERAADHFDTLTQACGDAAKVVVTSRTQHFFSDRQVRTALAERAELIPGYRLARLQTFDQSQIRQFLVKTLKSEAAATARLDLIDEVRDLLGLSSNPRMLSFVAGLPENELLEARDRDGTISAASLYQKLIDWWFLQEGRRIQPAGAPRALAPDDRWRAVTALALRLWQRTDRAINIAELPTEVAAALENLEARQLDVHTATHQVGSGTLLIRDEDGNFGFLHQSVLEWLVARRAADEVTQSGESALLVSRDISPLMADFFASLVGRKKAIDWGQGSLSRETSDAAKKNATLVLGRLNVAARSGASFADKNLRGQVFQDHLPHAQFSGADLREASLQDIDLTGATFRRANLSRANLERAGLRETDFAGADLSLTRLTGADLRGARFRGARLRMAKLQGARVTAEQLSGCDLWGAAVPWERFRADPQLPCPSLGATAVAFASDGALLVVAYRSGMICVWDAEVARQIRSFRAADGEICLLRVDKEGRTVTSVSKAGRVSRWDLTKGELVGSELQVGFVMSVDVSRDGQWLAASTPGDSKVRVWRLGEKEPPRHLEGHQYAVRCVRFSPDGESLATGSSDRSVMIWGVADGGRKDVLPTTGLVLSLAYTPNGSHLAIGQDDSIVLCWDLQTRLTQSLTVPRPEKKSHEHESFATVWFSATSKRVMAASQRTALRSWTLPAGTLEANTSPGEDPIVVVDPAGPEGAIAACDGTGAAYVWDSDKESSPRLFGGAAVETSVRMASSASGSVLVTCVGNVLRRWNAERLEEQGSTPLASLVHFAVSSDGLQLAWAAVPSKELEIRDTGRDVRFALPLRNSVVRGFVFDHSGNRLATVSSEGVVDVWDLTQQSLMRSFLGPRGLFLASFSQDGGLLAVASDGPSAEVGVWETDTWKQTEAFGIAAQTLSFGPKRRLVVSGEQGTTMWSLAREKVLVDKLHDVGRVAVGATGLLAIANSRSVRVLDLNLAEQGRIQLDAPPKALVFLRHDQALGVAFGDGSIRIWDLKSYREIALLILGAEGWAISDRDGRYRWRGEISGRFWHAVNLCRYEPGELDAHPEMKPAADWPGLS
jgi:WD40 repeat protein/uncharacterized protein YjbI with pentapeptide repeats